MTNNLKVRILFIYSITLVMFISAFPLYSRDYKKNEDMIQSIISDEGQEREASAEENRDAVADDAESEDAEKKGEEKRQGRPGMSGKDALLLKNGIELYNSGMFDSSMSSFEELLAEFPASAFADSARIWAGRINLKKNRYDEAIKLFSEVGENSGEYPASLFYSGEALSSQGDLNRSIETYKKLYNTFPENEFSDKSILMAGKLYLRINRGYQALESAITIIKNYSDRETVDDAYYLMAKIYEKDSVLKDSESARKIYRIILKKADSGEKYFKDSPLLPVVKRDLHSLERTYFRLEQ